MCSCVSDKSVAIDLFGKTTCLTICTENCEMCTKNSGCIIPECIYLVNCRFASACTANCLKCTEKADASGTECIADQCEEKYALMTADKTCMG